MRDEGKILVIDDSEIVLSRIRTALSNAGWEVLTTSQTVGNARHLRSCDLVILDFHMPGIDGAEVLASLRSVGAPSTCLFYLYTSDERVADEYAKHGFDGAFLLKGDEKALVSQVRAVFRMIKLRAISAKSSK